MKRGILNRHQLDRIDERMREIRERYVSQYPEVEVTYDIHSHDYEVWVDFDHYKKGGEPIATH